MTIDARVPRQRGSLVARVALLTLLLGSTVVVSWVGVRGTSVLQGPGPMGHPTWFLVWAVQAVLAFAIMVGVEWLRPSVNRAAMLGSVVGAWIGQLGVAAAFLTVTIDELGASAAPIVWLIATGIVVQPLAGIVGGLVARARRP